MILHLAMRIKFSMAQHSSVGPFDRGKEDWTACTERLEQYFAANDVKDATKQRAILLSACGVRTYQVIRNLTGETHRALIQRVGKSCKESLQPSTICNRPMIYLQHMCSAGRRDHCRIRGRTTPLVRAL